mgnify:CR=1 FL=1
MYENYSIQSLPERDYRELLGSALCVFNANNAFIIENILKIENDQHDWWELMDQTSGILLRKVIIKQYSDKIPKDIIDLFDSLVKQRNRIIHSSQVTGPKPKEEQLLYTRDRITGQQFFITREYLLRFIKENEELSTRLYALRDQLEKKK